MPNVDEKSRLRVRDNIEARVQSYRGYRRLSFLNIWHCFRVEKYKTAN